MAKNKTLEPVSYTHLEDVKSGEQGVVYLSGEFFANALVLPANGSAADLEVPFRALGIFLK